MEEPVNLIRRRAAPAPAAPVDVPACPAAAAVPLTEADQAEKLRAEAAQVRAGIDQARTEAEQLLQAVRAEAQRLVAVAEQRAGALMAGTRDAQRLADDLDERAQYLAHAHTLRCQAQDAEQQAADLEAEVQEVGELLEGLTRRQAGLGEQREDTGAALAAAREAGDVAEVGVLRGRLSAVDEVTAVLSGRQQSLRERLAAIGETAGGGELGRAVAQAAASRAELRQVLNRLDPDRPEARLDHLAEVLQAQLEQALEPGPQPVEPRTFVPTRLFPPGH